MHNVLKILTLVSVIYSCCACLSSDLFAQEEQVFVEIRALVGKTPLDDVEATAPQSKPIVLEQGLEDLRSQLQKLHYRRYELLDTESAVVPLKRKGTITLANGNTVIVRPLYVNNEKAGLWLHWKDKTGTELLDTRLHFCPGKPMLTGTEHSAQRGIILAIRVKNATEAQSIHAAAPR